MQQDVSIIIPTLNCRTIVRPTIESAATQNGVTTQIVVIDGGSSDGTQSEIAQTLPESSVFISEPDAGIFDAMNKGIECSRGRYLYFLGAGDCLASDESLHSLIKHSDHNDDLVFGTVLYDTGQVKTSYFTWRLLFYNSMHHQGCIYSRRVFENFRYDPDLGICADYELNLRLWLNRVKSKQLDKIVARAPLGGISTRASSAARIFSECEKVRLRSVPFPVGRILSAVECTRLRSKQLFRPK